MRLPRRRFAGSSRRLPARKRRRPAWRSCARHGVIDHLVPADSLECFTLDPARTPTSPQGFERVQGIASGRRGQRRQRSGGGPCLQGTAQAAPRRQVARALRRQCAPMHPGATRIDPAATTPGRFRPRLTLQTLTRGDGLLGMRAHPGFGPRGAQLTAARVDWTYTTAQGLRWDAPAPTKLLNSRSASVVTLRGAWGAGVPMRRDAAAEADARDALWGSGLRPLPMTSLQWRDPRAAEGHGRAVDAARGVAVRQLLGRAGAAPAGAGLAGGGAARLRAPQPAGEPLASGGRPRQRPGPRPRARRSNACRRPAACASRHARARSCSAWASKSTASRWTWRRCWPTCCSATRAG